MLREISNVRLVETRLDWQETSIVTFTPTHTGLPSLLTPLLNAAQRKCREDMREMRNNGVPTRSARSRSQAQAMRRL